MKAFIPFDLLFLLCLATSALGIENKKRSLRWITKDAALSYLTRDMSNLEEFKALLRPLVVERVSGTAGNKAVQEHIKSYLSNWHVETDTFNDTTPYGVKEFTNIIATFDPSKSTKIVLACHFDSKYFPRGKFVAASDSAVPCGVLLETARQLQCLLEKGPKEKSSASDLTLQLLFLDGEEAFKDWTATDSIYGSRHLAKRWAAEPDPANSSLTRIKSIREFILLDLIGTSDTTIPQHFTSTSELYENLVKAENYLRSKGYLTGKHLGPVFNGQKSWGGIEDDHMPFLNQGVDVVHLISSPFPSVWHQLTDDWDHLDFNLIDDFSRIFRLFISNLLHLQPESRGCRKK
ncbi:unnamed protein product [Candidula unifasciata]|uniref:Glutaminyl-peptide cyclotransferase n=1 Tax=Candidula unifasciata TaxID=100452 RepID=A0A8S3Z9A1_9EUPU|nr:unnamed protein product [Candidula unifasciata]